MSVAGMKILVTGASSGIGAHIAKFLVQRGAKVVVAARRIQALEALAAEAGTGMTAMAMDVGDAEAAEAGVAQAAEHLGGLDGLFNNAGTSWGGRTLAMPDEEWARVMDINVNAVFRVANAAARLMVSQKTGGSIVSTASILGLGTGSGVAAYATSKAAVVHLTRSLAQEYARYNIRVNAIAPGYFPTEMTEGFLLTEKGEQLKKHVPMRRFGELHELEGPMELLLGSQGSFITGVTLPVDGGHLSRPMS
ncbi:MAG: SDR family oxidoreductase [Pseudomonadota bacterium]